jgi:plasmid stabilization system protein ParE
MTYRVELSARAEADMARIHGRLAERSPEGAARWYEAFWDAVARLQLNPFACGLAHESGRFDEELRHLLFGTRRGRIYRALFIVRGDSVIILAIRWPGEKPMKPRDIMPEG